VGPGKKEGALMLKCFDGLMFLSGRNWDNIVRLKDKKYRLGLAGERESYV